jgi:hypothetical protein
MKRFQRQVMVLTTTMDEALLADVVWWTAFLVMRIVAVGVCLMYIFSERHYARQGRRSGQYREILSRRFACGPDHCFGLDGRASLAEQPQW